MVSRELQREDGVFATRDEGEDGVGVRQAEWRKREREREKTDDKRLCEGEKVRWVKYLRSVERRMMNSAERTTRKTR